VLHFPLPTERTIRSWLSKVNLKVGILFPVLCLLSVKFREARNLEKKCILAIDEISINDSYCYDEIEDKIFGGNKNAMVFSIRGLFRPWKQVVAYYLDGNVSKKRVLDLIEQIHGTGLEVVGLVHDMGTKNVGLWKELNTCQFEDLKLVNSSFRNPVTGKSVYVFPDFPHLIKLLRNHLFDQGILLQDKTVIGKKLLQDVVSAQRNELKITFKVSEKDLNVRNRERQNVHKAWKFFSNTMSKAILFLFANKKKEANFFKLINDFCDIMNVRVKDKKASTFKLPYGFDIEKQDKILNEAYETIANMKVGKRVRSLAPFQKGFLISISSLQNLFADMKNEVGCSYILTSRLNQDYLESLFSRIRGLGGFALNPTATQIKSRIKRLVFNLSFVTPKNSPVSSSEEDYCLSASMLSSLMNVKTENEKSPIINDEQLDRITDIVPEIEFSEIVLDKMTHCEKIKTGAEEYVAGYMVKKLKDEFPGLMAYPLSRQPLWVKHVSDGGLCEPSTAWLRTFQKFEEWFEAYHGNNSVLTSPNVVNNLISLLTTNYPFVPETAIKLYAKIRTFIKIKVLNKMSFRKCNSSTNNENELHENVDVAEAEFENLYEVLDNIQQVITR